MLWQLAQRIKAAEKEEGRDVEVYMDVKIRVNNGSYYQLIDNTVDLAAENC